MSDFSNFDLEASLLQDTDLQGADIVVAEYDKFIVLSKKDVSNFLKIVEPLTKATIDLYGKSVLINPLTDKLIELNYYNNPYRCRMVASNSSSKATKAFNLSIATLKKIAAASYSSIVFVEDNDEIKIAMCNDLIPLEYDKLDLKQYDFVQAEVSNAFDRDAAQFALKHVGGMLSYADRPSEKNAIVINNQLFFNTGAFVSSTKSPFTDVDCILYNQVISQISSILDAFPQEVKYGIDEDESKLILNVGDYLYTEMPIGLGQQKVREFLPQASEQVLKFDGTVSVINDNFIKMIQMVKALDYLSDVITIKFTNDAIILEVSNTNHSKHWPYTYPYLSGKPEQTGEMKVNAATLEGFMGIQSAEGTMYSFNANGFGITNAQGKFLLRKNA